jgi:hypothetical protein
MEVKWKMKVEKREDRFVLIPEHNIEHNYKMEKEFLKEIIGAKNFSEVHFPRVKLNGKLERKQNGNIA